MTRKLKKIRKAPFFLILSLIILVVFLVLITLINLNTSKKLSSNAKAIQGGNLVSSDSYPFVVAIFDASKYKQNYETGETNLYKISGTGCTGSLISSQYVLTAAHCVVEFTKDDRPLLTSKSKKANSIGIAIGFSDLKNDRINYKDRIVVFGSEIKQNFITADADNHLSTINDIALIKINKILDLKTFKTISYIKDVDLKNSNKQVLTLGYGVTSNEDESLPIKLRSVLLNIISINDPRAHIIARGYKKGVKSGDSGGPLLLWRNKKWNLIGITKADVGSQTKDHDWIRDSIDSVFTDISVYASWIKDNSGVDVNQGTFVGTPPLRSTSSYQDNIYKK